MTDTLKKIHHRSLDILKRCGFKVSHPLLAGSLKECGVRVDGDIAFFEQEQVMELLGRAPRQFTLYARNPAHNMTMGGNKSYFAPAYGSTYIADAGGVRRSALFDDYLVFARLVHQSPHFKINGGILVQPGDIPANDSALAMLYATLVSSDKCILGIAGTTEDLERAFSLCATAFGGTAAFAEKPHVLTLINTISPLQLGPLSAETIIASAQYKQPLIVSPGPMAGATGPVTAEGNIVLGNAETLAVIAVIQALAPGLPVLYGFQPSTMNMQTGGVSIATPRCIQQMEYSSKLARFYGLPNRCGGSLTDAKMVSAQSGSESIAALMVAKENNASLIIHSAGILDSYSAVSYEKFILDLQNIDYIVRLGTSLDLSEEQLAMSTIADVGIGGEYLTSGHTLKHCREEMFDRTTGIDTMLESYHQPLFDESVRSALDACLLEHMGEEHGTFVIQALDSNQSFPFPLDK